MKQILKLLLISTTLLSVLSFWKASIHANNYSNYYDNNCNNCCIGPCDGYPFLLPRSQGRNGVRELIGWQQFINKYDVDATYGDFAITLEYNRSMRPHNIAQFYFGDQLASCNSLLIQGSEVTPRHQKAWVADYFGLPADYSSVIQFDPTIDNFVVDFHFYIGLGDCSNCSKGAYLRIDAPLVHTRWDLNTTECIKERSTGDFWPGYLAKDELSKADLSPNFLTFMLGNTTFGDMQNPICFGKFPVCPMTQTRLADIQATLGWNFVQDCDYHFGLFIDAVFPTGTRPNACYLFEPIIGNGKHWELGFGVSSSYIFNRSKYHEDRYFGIWFDARFHHMFKSCQRRSFDFCNKPSSRYMLLEELDTADRQLLSSTDGGENYTKAIYQYSGKLIPAINYTTFLVDAKINLQADIVVKIGYIRDSWSFDFGYNLWARTGEKFDCTSCEPCVETKKYALKGNAWLYGEIEIPVGEPEEDIIFGPFALSNSNSNATIMSTGALDNPQPGYYEEPSVTQIGRLMQIDTANELDISVPPKFVSRADLNVGKSPSAITHKLFFHMSHAWKHRKTRWMPFLGFGGSVELDHSSDIDCCASCCEPCCNTQDKKSKKGGISQWGVWLKGGIYFE